MNIALLPFAWWLQPPIWQFKRWLLLIVKLCLCAVS